MLHKDSDSCSNTETTITATFPPARTVASEKEITSLSVTSSVCSRSQVLLATAWVTVEPKSEASKNAGLDFRCVDAETYSQAAHIKISPLKEKIPTISVLALILKSLTVYAPKRASIDSNLNHLADLSWADKNPLSADPIDLIVGADLYAELILDGVRKGAIGQPMAQNSVLGWVISGPVSSSTVSAHSAVDQSPAKAIAHHCFQSSFSRTETPEILGR
ncbi:hypothetical protein RF55_14869 [Lasius niger]|uniref:Uncharacterized protein n=1 Tax=Lasius niger TaxID=67767 RepID=A0A0J7K758_LASNI|nr:hypothetical protein RF55_14869 [Lasius niger]